MQFYSKVQTTSVIIFCEHFIKWLILCKWIILIVPSVACLEMFVYILIRFTVFLQTILTYEHCSSLIIHNHIPCTPYLQTICSHEQYHQVLSTSIHKPTIVNLNDPHRPEPHFWPSVLTMMSYFPHPHCIMCYNQKPYVTFH
jgi:hypothetical protein